MEWIKWLKGNVLSVYLILVSFSTKNPVLTVFRRTCNMKMHPNTSYVSNSSLVFFLHRWNSSLGKINGFRTIPSQWTVSFFSSSKSIENEYSVLSFIDWLIIGFSFEMFLLHCTNITSCAFYACIHLFHSCFDGVNMNEKKKKIWSNRKHPAVNLTMILTLAVCVQSENYIVSSLFWAHYTIR